MLWVAVLAVYLGVLRWTEIPLIAVLVLTVCLTVIIIAWIWWGLRGGVIAVSVISVGHACLAVSSGRPWEWGDMIVDFGVILLISGAVGLLGLFCVDIAAHLVDWLDSLGRKSRSPDS